MRFQHTENSCAIRHGIQIRWRLLIRVVAMKENGVLAARIRDELCWDKKVVCVEENKFKTAQSFTVITRRNRTT
jgi:hypothetical protein